MISFKVKIKDSIRLANWVIKNSTSSDVSHLKLQKLLFYCYSACSSRDLESELGSISFEAWKYGPVNVAVYDRFKKYGSQPIEERVKKTASYPEEVEKLLITTLSIYEKMDAGQLVRQTHLEDPWVNHFKHGSESIPSSDIKKYFKIRFAKNEVRVPEVLSDSGFFEIDNLPIKKFRDLEELSYSI